jgi:hypothetical protein
MRFWNKSLRVMSAVTPKADIIRSHYDVRFVPEADVEKSAEKKVVAAGPFAGMSASGH